MNEITNKPTDSQPPSLPRLLRIDEVADVLGVSVQTIRLWERKGQLPALRFEGGLLRFDPEAVRRLIADANGPRRIPSAALLAARGGRPLGSRRRGRR